MLAFLKKWRKAYLEEKGDRLHAQVEAERNALCNGDCLSFGEATSILSTYCKDKVAIKSHTGTEDECMVKGYYY